MGRNNNWLWWCINDNCGKKRVQYDAILKKYKCRLCGTECTKQELAAMNRPKEK